MHTVKYKDQEYIFPEGDEQLPFEEKGKCEELECEWADDNLLLCLSGCHIGPPIQVWVMGIKEDESADCPGEYTYHELRWPDKTPLTDSAEADKWIGDFYEMEIMEQIQPRD